METHIIPTGHFFNGGLILSTDILLLAEFILLRLNGIATCNQL